MAYHRLTRSTKENCKQNICMNNIEKFIHLKLNSKIQPIKDKQYMYIEHI